MKNNQAKSWLAWCSFSSGSSFACGVLFSMMREVFGGHTFSCSRSLSLKAVQLCLP